MDEIDWIDSAEAVRLSGFHPEHLRELVRSGAIVGRKWGRSWMISRASLESYLSSSRKPGPKPGSHRKHPKSD